jgi:transcription initiation factor TFIIF subunit alpha
MAPKVASASLLFHPKPKKRVPPPVVPPTAPAVLPVPVLKPDDDLKLPDGPFQEFRLMSSALNGWKYDVMKFDSRKPIDISTWQTPIKLNRKEPRREESSMNMTPEAVGPMLGPDGKPVIGMDGRVVMVDSEGRPIHAGGDGIGGGMGRDVKGKGVANARKKFQKKTRQVFLVPESVRQLRKEERYPWVMEDSSQKEIWVGKLEEVSKSETHAFFMPAANDIFKFVPAHRWYKFQKKPNYHIPTLEEAESIVRATLTTGNLCGCGGSPNCNRWPSIRRTRIQSAGYFTIATARHHPPPLPLFSKRRQKDGSFRVAALSYTLQGKVWVPGGGN